MKNKSRMISFRLSEKEFEALKSLYRAHGARSVSEFARSAMQRMIAETPPDETDLEDRVNEMCGRLQHLDRQVARLYRILNLRNDGQPNSNSVVAAE
mgnify:FL=1|jgi:hypothetical protein